MREFRGRSPQQWAAMTRKNRYYNPCSKYKRVKVVKANFVSGGSNSLLKNWIEHGAMWELVLECGCDVTRPVKWKTPGKKGGNYKRHDDEDAAKPAPGWVYHNCLKNQGE